MLVALTEVYHTHQLFNSSINSLLRSITCCKCMFQHFQQMHHDGWSHKSKGTDHETAAWSVSTGMTELPQDTCINYGPNTTNTMPTNYIIWKMIQLSLSYHLFAEIEPSNPIKVLDYFKQGAALREFYIYWHNCSQISYMPHNMTCTLSSCASFKPILP
jgi:hypothetical protein